MSVGWHIFRIICLLQMLASVFFSFTNFISFFITGSGQFFFRAVAFAVIAAFSIFAVNLLNTNYPDKPVVGKQKTLFNWLFLLNFLLLAFLFAHFFAAIRTVQYFAYLTGQSIFSLSFRAWVPVIFFSGILLFQFILLYGLYILRRVLYINFFSRQQFDFES